MPRSIYITFLLLLCLICRLDAASEESGSSSSSSASSGDSGDDPPPPDYTDGTDSDSTDPPEPTAPPIADSADAHIPPILQKNPWFNLLIDPGAVVTYYYPYVASSIFGYYYTGAWWGGSGIFDWYAINFGWGTNYATSWTPCTVVNYRVELINGEWTVRVLLDNPDGEKTIDRLLAMVYYPYSSTNQREYFDKAYSYQSNTSDPKSINVSGNSIPRALGYAQYYPWSFSPSQTGQMRTAITVEKNKKTGVEYGQITLMMYIDFDYTANMPWWTNSWYGYGWYRSSGYDFRVQSSSTSPYNFEENYYATLENRYSNHPESFSNLKTMGPTVNAIPMENADGSNTDAVTFEVPFLFQGGKIYQQKSSAPADIEPSQGQQFVGYKANVTYKTKQPD